MKWIFFSLMIINFGYFAVNQMGDKTTPSMSSQVDTKPGVAPVRLLSEVGAAVSREEEAVRVLENPMTVAVDPGEQQCSGLGPFVSLQIAQNTLERLSALGYEAELKAIDRQLDEADYRVVLPPFKSLQEAFRRLRELKAREIDSYVITQGQDAQGISLGLFSSQRGAEEHQRTLVELGYAVVIKEIPRMNRGYWLLRDDGTFDQAIVQEVTSEFKEISVTESVCLN